MAADSFENIVRTLLEAEGFWIQQSFKVNLSLDEKRSIEKPTAPRPEIDILAFDFARNVVNVLEVKSYLDSSGVRLGDLKQTFDWPKGRYKLFTCALYERVVLNRLKIQLMQSGMANVDTTLRLGLVFGNIYSKDAAAIASYARSKRWFFWSSRGVQRRLKQQAERQYENDPAIISAKILLRGLPRRPAAMLKDS